MKVLAVCAGTAQKLPGKSYKTGINKVATSGVMMIDEQGLVGDAICNRKHHGGIDQAIYIEGSITLGWWERELGVVLEPGAFGENLVIEGIDNASVAIGDRFVIGEVTLEVTSARIPCATFAAKMGDPMFVKRYAKAGRPGIYCRVISGGVVASGTAVRYAPYQGERVLMPELMATHSRSLSVEDRARYLSTPIHHKLRSAILAQ